MAHACTRKGARTPLTTLLAMQLFMTPILFTSWQFFCENLQHISHTTRITRTVVSSVTVKQLDTLLTEHSVTSSAGRVSMVKRLLLPVVLLRVRCSHVWWRSLLGKFLCVPCVKHWSSGTSRNTSVTCVLCKYSLWNWDLASSFRTSQQHAGYCLVVPAPCFETLLVMFSAVSRTTSPTMHQVCHADAPEIACGRHTLS